MTEAKQGKLMSKLSSWPVKKKIAILIVLGVIIYGTTIVADSVFLTQEFAGGAIHADLPVYRARTSTILDGGLLYKDVHTETPPLINYLLVPAQVLGGDQHVWVYSAYFSFFGILTGLILYLVLRRYNDNLAFLVGLMFIISPFGFIEGGTGEDETIVAFTVAVPALLMLLGKDRLAPTAAALAVWTKMWAILLVPIQFLRAHGWKEKAKVVLAVAAVTALVAGPFLILCQNDFVWFLKYYFIDNSARNAEGFSAFSFLKTGGYAIPSQIELALVLIGLAAAYLYAYKKKLGVWESITLVTVVFFALYPKMHTGYYLIPLTFLFVWGAQNAKIAVRCFLIYAPVILAVALSPAGNAKTYLLFPGSWMVGLAMSLLASAMLIEAAYQALKERPFVDLEAEGSEKEKIEEGALPQGASAT